jgi:hypothetical protein
VRWHRIASPPGRLLKVGCITGHDIFVVKAAPWFGSNQTAGRPQGGIVTAFDASTGHPLNVPGARLSCERRGGGRRLLLIGSPMGSTGLAGLAGTLAGC